MHSVFVRKTGYYIIRATGKKNCVSWHFTVDDREAIQHLPVNEKALHAGAANRQSVAIEVCMHRGIDQQAGNERAAALAAVLAHDLGLGRDALRTHKSWTGKACPTLLLDMWDQFVADVEALRATIPAGRVLLPDSELEMEESPAPAQASAEDEPDIDHEQLALSISGETEFDEGAPHQDDLSEAS